MGAFFWLQDFAAKKINRGLLKISTQLLAHLKSFLQSFPILQVNYSPKFIKWLKIDFVACEKLLFTSEEAVEFLLNLCYNLLNQYKNTVKWNKRQGLPKTLSF